jgi:diacylglycerol kinase family enzyme
LDNDELYLHVIFNARSGDAEKLGIDRDILSDKLASAGHTAEIDHHHDLPFAARLAAAKASPANVIVAAGGDGTVTGIADAVMASDKVLAILPLGTANLLARDLAIPLDIDGAIDVIGSMSTRAIDAAFVNDRLFLHKVVVGTFPEIATEREKLRGETSLVGKLWFVKTLFARIAASRKMAISIRGTRQHRGARHVHAIAVANNGYDEGFGKVFARETLDRGIMTVYLLKRLTPLTALRMAAEMVFGLWRRDEALTFEETTAVTIEARPSSVEVMIDGEVETMSMPLDFRIKPRALNVLAPDPGKGA